MSSETSMVAVQYCLQEWAAQIRECQSRPSGMSVANWCACHGITKANYYYRLRCVREACLESIPGELFLQKVVPVKPELLRQDGKNNGAPQAGLNISINDFSIHVTEATSMLLLSEVLKVMQHAE